MTRHVTTFLALLLLFASGCASPRDPGVAWQNSTIDALLDGNYEGDVTFAELRKHGITYVALDMIWRGSEEVLQHTAMLGLL
jgi:hypothetical protein